MTRHRLPNRRASTTIAFTWNDLGFTTSFSQCPATGRVLELFIGNHKATGAIDMIAKDSAITCSIALQFGADFETIRRGLLRDSQGAPASPLGAAMDAISRMDGADPTRKQQEEIAAMQPRVKMILKHCRLPGSYLQKTYRNLRGGGRHRRGGGRQVETEYFLEPGSIEVAERYAREAIASGKLVMRDPGLFGTDDPAGAQSWSTPSKRHSSRTKRGDHS